MKQRRPRPPATRRRNVGHDRTCCTGARPGVPRLADDYTAAAARRRLAFLAEATGVSPEHLGRYSFDPAVLAGNIENFVGVAQVPIGSRGRS